MVSILYLGEFQIKFDTVLARWLVCFHCKGSTIETADVAEWQTRSAQDAVGAILWRFKSSHPHQIFLDPLIQSIGMAKRSLPNSSLWEEFQRAARKRRRNPVRLLEDYMRQCLAVWEDQMLDEELRRDVQRSGHAEEDAVDIVRRHRLGKTHRAAQ